MATNGTVSLIEEQVRCDVTDKNIEVSFALISQDPEYKFNILPENLLDLTGEISRNAYLQDPHFTSGKLVQVKEKNGIPFNGLMSAVISSDLKEMTLVSQKEGASTYRTRTFKGEVAQ